jgi:hypothetical protein
MTADQEALYNMFRDTNKVGTDNPAILVAVPKMGTVFTELGNRINNISGLISLQAQVLTGMAIDKEQLKEVMATLQYNYAGPGRAWADENGSDANYNALNISKSKVLRTRDDQAGPVAQNVFNLLNTNSAALVAYGLSAAQLLELQNAINDYVASVPLPISGINQRQTYTQNIEIAINDTSKLLNRRLDNLVRGQVNIYGDFHSTYFNSREIIDPPTKPTTFNIRVERSDDSTPILQAKAEAVGTIKVAFTDGNGQCALKQFKKGVYTILVTKPGFHPIQQIVEIGLGQVKNLTFRLVPLP